MKTPEQRKSESTEFLLSKGVNVIDHLPYLEPEETFKLRSSSDVAKRIICLVFVTDFALKHADETYWDYINKNSLKSWFTSEEWEFINSKSPDTQLNTNMSWRIEGAYLLLWALGKIKKLPFPNESINPDEIYPHLPSFNNSPLEFIESVSLIEKSDIIDKEDIIYRMHWATRQASMEQEEMPANLEPGVVQEWHHAINWLAYYDEMDWDDVSTDT